MTTKTTSTFDKLYAVDVSAKTEKKNGLTYLSWASAWAEAKKICPTLNYKVYEDVIDVTPDGEAKTINYFSDGKTAYVKVGVTIDNIEYIEYLPIMDFRHKSIGVDKITSWDVGTTIKRCLTKALAMHGLGLKVYEGDDGGVQEITEPITLNGMNGKPSLTPTHKEWKKVVEWAKSQHGKGISLEDMLKKIEPKYSIPSKTKTAIKNILK